MVLCTPLNQSDNGFLWVGTGKGLFRFDGFTFYPVQYPDSLEGRYPTASLKDKTGKLWFGFNDGSVFYSEGSKLEGCTSAKFQNSIRILLKVLTDLYIIIPQEKPIFSVNPVNPEICQTIHIFR